jgi:hypothetical protein
VNVNKNYFSVPLSIQGNTTNVKIKWWNFLCVILTLRKIEIYLTE